MLSGEIAQHATQTSHDLIRHVYTYTLRNKSKVYAGRRKSWEARWALAPAKGLEGAGCMYSMLLPCSPWITDYHTRATYCKSSESMARDVGILSCCNKGSTCWNLALMPVELESRLECCAVVVSHTPKYCSAEDVSSDRLIPYNALI